MKITNLLLGFLAIVLVILVGIFNIRRPSADIVCSGQPTLELQKNGVEISNQRLIFHVLIRADAAGLLNLASENGRILGSSQLTLNPNTPQEVFIESTGSPTLIAAFTNPCGAASKTLSFMKPN